MRDMRDSGIDWLGSIPSDWKLRKIKFCFDIVKDIIGYEGPPVLACTNTGIKVKDLTYGSGQIAKDYSNYQWVRLGDFVMNNLDLVGGWIDVSTLEGVTSPDYRVFRAKGPQYDNGYYRQLFQLCYMDRIFRDTSNVVEGMGWGRMQAPVFKNFVVPVPSIEAQRAIATHLENYCADIDRAITAAEESLAEYLAYKRSLVFGAVAYGINSSGDTKGCAIQWLDEIPTNWQIVRFKNLYRLVKRPFKKGVELLSVYLNYGVIRYEDSDGSQVHKPSESLEKYQLVNPGDLVLNNQQAWRGSVGISPYEGIISPAYHVFEPIDAAAINDVYMNALFRNVLVPGFDLDSRGVGSIQRCISVSDYQNNALVLLPPIEEQIAIADYLDEKCAQIDAAIAAKRSIIDELKAYKKSLVYEYVTGKREVPCQ